MEIDCCLVAERSPSPLTSLCCYYSSSVHTNPEIWIAAVVGKVRHRAAGTRAEGRWAEAAAAADSRQPTARRQWFGFRFCIHSGIRLHCTAVVAPQSAALCQLSHRAVVPLRASWPCSLAIDQGDPIGTTPLMTSASGGHSCVVRMNRGEPTRLQ